MNYSHRFPFTTIHTEGSRLQPNQRRLNRVQMTLQRGDKLLEAYQRVRRVSKVRYRVEAQLPQGVLEIYIYLPT